MILVGTALAHVPHDEVVLVAAHPELDGTWCALLDPWSVDVLACTDDGIWSHVGGDPLADELRAGAGDADTLLLLGASRLWRSDGTTWDGVEHGGATSLAVAEGAAWLGGPGGLLSGPPEGPWTTILEGDVALLAGGEHGVVAFVDGAVRAGDDDLGRPADDVSALVRGAEATWAGTAGGDVWRHAGSAWERCAELPSPSADDTPRDVVRLATDGDTLLAATAWRAPFVSTDGCASWEDRHAPLDTDYTSGGHAEGPEESVTALLAADGAWIVGGWAGLATSADAGGTWEEAVPLPPDFMRGLAIGPEGAWLGGYAGGVGRTFDDGASFDAPSIGLNHANIQTLATSSGHVLTIVGHHLWASADLGATWTRADSPFEEDAHVFYVGGPERVWASGYREEDRAAAVAEWLGGTWTSLGALQESMGGMVEHVATLDGTICAAGPLLTCSDDDGTSWERRLDPAGEIHALAVSGARVMLAAGTTLSLSDDGGRTWSVALDTGLDAVIFLAEEDAVLWAATDASRLLSSSDRGETWEELPERVPGSVLSLATSPLTVGTSDGTFRYEGGSFVRWAEWVRVDDTHTDFVTCERCPDPEPVTTAAVGTMTRIVPGAAMEVTLRGTAVAVFGDSEGTSDVILEVDDVAEARFGGDADDGRLVLVTDLTPGRHTVRVVGVSGDGVRVDGIEGYGVAPDAEVPAGRCGCGGGGAWVVLFVGMRRRRALLAGAFARPAPSRPR